MRVKRHKSPVFEVVCACFDTGVMGNVLKRVQYNPTWNNMFVAISLICERII